MNYFTNYTIYVDGEATHVSNKFVRNNARKKNTMKKLSFPVKSFRKIPNPYGSADSSAQMYFSICDVTEIPADFPMETNPRKQNLKTGVAKKIKASLEAEA